MIYASVSQELVAKYLKEKNPYAQQTDMDENSKPECSVPSFLL
jgi:hypothetical protein